MRDEGLLRRMQPALLRQPSMVVTVAPSMLAASTRQELARRPSTRTVQAPHWPWSQPFLVPVNPSRWRSRSSSVVQASIARSRLTPLMVRLVATSAMVRDAALMGFWNPFR